MIYKSIKNNVSKSNTTCVNVITHTARLLFSVIFVCKTLFFKDFIGIGASDPF